MTEQTLTLAPAPAPEYRYCIGWMSIDGNVVNQGVIDVSRSAPIVDLTDVQGVQDFLREHYRRPRLGVLSFSLYADPPA
jgi:hypothetical protein